MYEKYVIVDTYSADVELYEIEEAFDIIDIDVARKKIKEILDEAENGINKLELLKDRAKRVLSKIEKPRKSVEEIRVELEDMERKVKVLTEKEAITVALSRLPSATEKIKRKAEVIIEKYGLTEEEIGRLYRYYFE